MFKNFLKILKSKIGIIGFLIGITTIGIPSYYFMNKELIIGNLGYSFYVTELVLTIIIALFFGLFIGATLYKIQYFSVKKSGLGFLGGFLGVLISGCPACSITFASYIGLAGVISVFPYSGLELKVLSVILLLIANYFTIKNLETCKIKK